MHLRLLVTVGVFIYYVSAVATIIDVLSGSVQYSTLLRHVKRLGLVPLINETRNLTLVAPVNSAFAGVGDGEITEQLLLYHLLNGTVLSTAVDKEAVVDSLNAGQSVLVSKNSEGELKFNKKSTVVEPDVNAEASVRGVVQAVDTLLDMPRGLCQEMADDGLRQSNTFSQFVTLELACSEDGGLPRPTTILAPSDLAFEKQFIDVELNYLLHPAASEDRMKILDRHMVDGFVRPQAMDARTVATYDGVPLELTPSMTVNDTYHANNHTTLVENGVIYSYNDLFVDVEFTPQKYIYGLGVDDFVKEIEARGFEGMINDSSIQQTVFVPISMISNNNEAGPLKSKSALLYHFVQGQYHLDDFIGQSLLMTTQMETSKLLGAHQRLRFVSSLSGAFYLNGVPIVSEEYIVGNTSIYLVGDDLDLPPSLSQAVGPFFQSSYSLQFLETLDMLYPPKTTPWTVLLPTRRAWQKQGLLAKYLSSNLTALKNVFDSMIFESPFYSDSQATTVTLLTGERVPVSISGVHNGTLQLGGTKYNLDARDILFDSGVAHSIDHVQVPGSIDVTAEKLIAAGGRSKFIDLLHKRNMSHVLDPSYNHTILVPSLEYLEKHNVTESRPDIDLLLAMHILPENPVDSLLRGDSVATLATNVSLSAREVSEDIYIIQLVGGADHVLHIVDRGETTQSRSTVLFLDRLLRPEWLESPFPPFRNSPQYQLKTPVAILLGAVAGFVLLFVLISVILFLVMRNTHNRRILHKKERDPLLPRHHSRNPSSQYSYDSVSTAPSSPIDTTSVHEQREFARHLNLPQQRNS
ncbi:hypothetical protein TRICI_002708 [Trichomonascus ciferrii]|uniref:FAS1 domain-containing protein n=1 Tax=Trichomonascus ciferrii TaxID=44093 RepID=A0A642V5Z4_9ASCO|nr:hypothetical protein TRICI_002708 [Trichomonascus ciferrii]